MLPRPLSALERAALEALLQQGAFEGVDAYRAQLDHARVVKECSCGCPTIDLEVDASQASRAPVDGDPTLPLWGEADDPETPDGTLDLTVWAPDGYLTELNVAWYGRQPPSVLPDPRSLRVGPGPPTTHVD